MSEYITNNKSQLLTQHWPCRALDLNTKGPELRLDGLGDNEGRHATPGR
jgi:hypothetical protein